jgi:peptide chain release factor subunit 1
MPHSNASVLILTPVKSGRRFLDSYFAGLESLSHPHDRLSLGILESDSSDGTYELLEQRLERSCPRFSRKVLLKKDFGFVMPDHEPRYSAVFQPQRRAVLARARNHLLFRALRDEDWVLWLDVDVVEYPRDIIEQLLACNADIVQPNCVVQYGGPSFDRNAWSAGGKKLLSDMRGQGRVRLESVGGTMLLIRADRHRDGLVFPPFFYGARSRWVRDPHPIRGSKLGEIETEGLGIMAKDMGIECWGLPDLEIRHWPG